MSLFLLSRKLRDLASGKTAVNFLGKVWDKISGRDEAKKSNEIAQQQLDMQKGELANQQATQKRAEILAEAEAIRNEEERLKKTPVRSSGTGKGLGRLVK